MRSIVFAIGFTLAGASVAQSQAQSPALTRDFVPQEVVAAAPKAPDLRPVDAPIGMTRSQAGVSTVKANSAAEPSAAAAVDPSTRNTLAIIGAIVVVIALLSLVL